MEPMKAMSIEDHQKITALVKEAIDGLRGRKIATPQIPMKDYLDELRTAVLGVSQHFSALAAVGYTEAMRDELATLAAALESAQILWNTERRGGRTEETSRVIETAEEVRSELLSAAVLALRNNTAGQNRISMIREGEGLADLVLDLADLAVLLTDFAAEFEAIKTDVKVEATRAATVQGALQKALAEENVARTLSGNKALRDSIYTLTNDALGEVRAFAAHAFRKDTGNTRRILFSSAYLRKRNRKASRRAAENDASVDNGPATDTDADAS